MCTYNALCPYRLGCTRSRGHSLAENRWAEVPAAALTHTHTHTPIHPYRQTHTHTHTDTRTHAHHTQHTRLHSHTYTHTHTSMQAGRQAGTFSGITLPSAMRAAEWQGFGFSLHGMTLGGYRRRGRQNAYNKQIHVHVCTDTHTHTPHAHTHTHTHTRTHTCGPGAARLLRI